MTNHWNAKTYSQFLDLRTRPARDLLTAIPESFQPKVVYDLGCGPGNSTVLLKQRWPSAEIIGMDSSDDMLNLAQKTYPDLTFVKGDIGNFTPDKKIDCLFANASLQWIDDHEKLIPKLIETLNSNGIIAIQMPNNFHAPTHQVTLDILQNNTKWRSLLGNLQYGKLVEPFYNLPRYYDLFIKNKMRAIQFWETKYFQEMTGYQEFFDWVKGTGLSPVFPEMDSSSQAEFEKIYITTISEKYPLHENNKILVPYRRIFMVVVKKK